MGGFVDRRLCLGATDLDSLSKTTVCELRVPDQVVPPSLLLELRGSMAGIRSFGASWVNE